jgi:hypothetical protein
MSVDGEGELARHRSLRCMDMVLHFHLGHTRDMQGLPHGQSKSELAN